jgi:hypothetical protein
MRGDPRGDGGATCKTAGFAYTGSNPVPATPPVTCENAAAVRWVMASERRRIPSDFPPPDVVPTPTARPVSLRGERGLARAPVGEQTARSRSDGWEGAVALRRPRGMQEPRPWPDQIAKASSSNATASRRFAGASTASS